MPFFGLVLFVMDIRRSINTKLWSDEWVEKLNPTEKLLWIYLLTNPQTNMLGIYEISIKRISFDTGIKADSIINALKAFERVKKAFYFNGYIILTNWIKNQSMNPNMVKSAEQLYSQLSNDLKDKLLQNGLESFESLSKGLECLPNASEKGKGKGNINEKEIEIEFKSFWEVYPRKVGKIDAEKAWIKTKDRPDIQTIIESIEAHKRTEQWQKDGGQYIPHPARFINRGGWFDEIEAKPEININRIKELMK